MQDGGVGTFDEATVPSGRRALAWSSWPRSAHPGTTVWWRRS